MTQLGGICSKMYEIIVRMLWLGWCINIQFINAYDSMILVIRWELFVISLKIISLHYSPWLFSFPVFRFLEVCWICLSTFKSKLESKQCINSTCLHKIESWLRVWNHSFKDANLLILIRSKWKKSTLADINHLESI